MAFSFTGFWEGITGILEKGLDIFDQFVEDKDLREKLKHEQRMKNIEVMSTFRLAFLRLSEKIIDAEIATGAKWRTPCIYVSGGFIGIMLFNNNILYPYLSTYMKVLAVPDELWYTFWGLCGLHLFDVVKTKLNNKDVNEEE